MIENKFRSSKEKFFHANTEQNFYKPRIKEEVEIGDSYDDYKILKELGKGSQGVIYKVQSLRNHQIYVMKKINLKQMSSQDQKEALKEAQILKRVKHPHIITYFKSFLYCENLCIIMEYAENGDLHRVYLSF